MIKMGGRGLKKNKIKKRVSFTIGGWAVVQERMKTNMDEREKKKKGTKDYKWWIVARMKGEERGNEKRVKIINDGWRWV